MRAGRKAVLTGHIHQFRRGLVDTMMKNGSVVLTAGVLAILGSTMAFAQGDPAVIERIIVEGKNNNRVWQHLEHLSYEIGTRLTGSSGVEKANHWTLEKFNEFGLQNGHLHEWGTIGVRFDRGPSSAKMVEPTTRDFEFTTMSWAPGTDGMVRGKVVKMPKTLEELEAVSEDIAGAWVLNQSSRSRRGGRRGVVPPGSTPEVRDQISAALADAGIAGYIFATRSELVVTYSGTNWSKLTESTLDDLTGKDVAVYVRRSDYDAMNSRIADGETVEVEIDLNNTFTEGPFPLYNTIAEIPGTEWPEQVVIVSGHLDSWDGPGAMGTQDNGTGTVVTLEAARLLMAAGAKPKRTIRFILWTGEEQGLLGSRAYVKGLTETEKANISVCLVDDGGTNYEGGLVGLESMEEMLTLATAAVTDAFPDMPIEIITRERMPRGGGSDHASFNAVGIPGFFWMEKGSGGREGKNYRFIHHTQHDTPQFAVPEYLVQSSTCAAITAYNLACADTMLPREVKREKPIVAEATPDPAKTDPAKTDAEKPTTQPAAVVVADPSGEWDATFSIGDDPSNNRPFTILLTMSEDKSLKGHTESQMGRSKIIKGEFDKDAGIITFTVDHEQYGEIGYKATFNAEGNMVGALSVGEFEADFTATRKK